VSGQDRQQLAERLVEEQRRYGLPEGATVGGLEVLLRHVYNNRDAALGALEYACEAWRKRAEKAEAALAQAVREKDEAREAVERHYEVSCEAIRRGEAAEARVRDLEAALRQNVGDAYNLLTQGESPTQRRAPSARRIYERSKAALAAAVAPEAEEKPCEFGCGPADESNNPPGGYIAVAGCPVHGFRLVGRGAAAGDDRKETA
jgi:hypothetical protein